MLDEYLGSLIFLGFFIVVTPMILAVQESKRDRLFTSLAHSHGLIFSKPKLPRILRRGKMVRLRQVEGSLNNRTVILTDEIGTQIFPNLSALRHFFYLFFLLTKKTRLVIDGAPVYLYSVQPVSGLGTFSKLRDIEEALRPFT